MEGSGYAWDFRDPSRSLSRGNQVPHATALTIACLDRLEMLQTYFPSFCFSFAKFTTK